MDCGIIRKTDLDILIRAASEAGRTFYAPTEGKRGVELAPVSGMDEVVFDYGNVKLSPKSVYFPQREVLCEFSGDTLRNVEIDATQTTVFGIRPCDAAALTFLDKVFSDGASRFRDAYYLTRRENSIVMALACNQPRTTCFCTSVGGSPVGTAGADILVTDIGEHLFFQACTKKGEEYLESTKAFQEPSAADQKARADVSERAQQSMSEVAIPDMKALPEKIDRGFEDPLWDSLTQNCLGCGICTYLCPTCHCFDITDEENGRGEGVRLRTWDSCQYPLFTLHASGHNPRVNKKQRLRQRIMHKFSYSVANTDDIFCVGCGRCITYCPVNIDIRESLNALSKL